MSATFETKQPPLSELLRQVQAGEIQLPDFQRPWVWDDLHIRELLASVTLSYPIGTVMLLQTGGDGGRFKAQPVEGVRLVSPLQPKRLILDGQQRLTSLYLALLSGGPVPTTTEKKKSILRVYYLDIRAALDPEKDRLDAILSIPVERQIRSDFGREVDLDLSSPAKEYENLCFPFDRILDPSRVFEWVNACKEFYGHSAEHGRLLDDFQKHIWLAFQNYQIPVIELLGGTPKEAVCQVFEKVNTGGVPLTVFELMTATFAADGFQLRKEWQERLAGIPERNLPGLSEQKVLQSFDATDFLTAVTLVASYRRSLESDRPVSCKRKDVLDLQLSQFQANADAVHRGLLTSAIILNREKVFDAKNLPYKTQLVPLAAICAVLGRRADHEPVRERLVRWYWCGVFGEMYGGANETRYALDIQQVLRWIDGGPEPRTIADASFSPTRLLTLQSRLSAAYKGLMSQLMQVGSRDFISGDPIELATFFDRSVDIHHVFPEAYCLKQSYGRELWDSILNKVALSASTNRRLGGQAPSRYLAAIERTEKLRPERVDEILETHLIHPVLLREDRFQEFCRDRAARLLDLIESAMAKEIPGRDSDEVIRRFGGPLLS